jgi:predicted nucleic acid-binding protein
VPSRATYYLDTNIIISVIETARPLTNRQREFITEIDSGITAAATSELTLAECLVKPITEKDSTLITAYMSFLDGRVNLPVLPITRQILLLAARRRSELGVKLPDAIHISTAETTGCNVFVTNDRGIRVPESMKLVFWNELIN